ncbi:MAG: NADH-quinone oxidoreductase subunit NuoH [Anaerolineae bacterium]
MFNLETALIEAGMVPGLAQLIVIVINAILLGSFGLVWIIFAIWIERKFAGRVQDRLGPNRTGPYGLFQTFADIGKLLIKEDITPAGADKHVYNFAPILAVASIVLIMAVVPLSDRWVGADLSVAALYFVAVASFATLAILLAGWSSNNKYALLGAFRSIAGLISYEVPMILSLAIPVLLAGSMSLNDIVKGQAIAYVFVVPISALIFFISQLAEVGRSPFDLIEAESEIIAGFMIEYSGMKFAMFYAAEFMHAFFICLLTSVLFLGGWRGFGAGEAGYELFGFLILMGKSFFVYMLVMLVRSTLPRIRIDQVMAFNWKFLVPLSLVNLLVVAFFARLFVPDYAAAQAAVEAGGFTGIVGSIFGSGFVAEFPRAVVLLVANIILWVVATQMLHRYGLEQRKKLGVVEVTPSRAASAMASD